MQVKKMNKNFILILCMMHKNFNYFTLNRTWLANLYTQKLPHSNHHQQYK